MILPRLKYGISLRFRALLLHSVQFFFRCDAGRATTRLPFGDPSRQFVRRCHPYARSSASQAVFGRMQLTLHATRRTPDGASRLVQTTSAWSVKTRRAPSRHCRDARVYGHATTAMNDNCLLYTSPSPRDGLLSRMPSSA